MRFGVCCQIGEAESVLSAGFDYVELAAFGFNGLLDTWDSEYYRSLPILATNGFLDNRVKLFEPGATPYMEYAVRTVERASSLRIPLMVIGSGASRKASELATGEQSFVEIVSKIADIGRPLGITMAPESLNRTETNVGNNLRNLALALGEAGVGYTADSYHILYEWNADGRILPIDALYEEQLPSPPSHVHIANLPRSGVDSSDPMLQAFAQRLRDLNYDANVSLECNRNIGFDLCDALAHLQRLFQ
jgi:sugar phosphate isomerase/epimerase